MLLFALNTRKIGILILANKCFMQIYALLANSWLEVIDLMKMQNGPWLHSSGSWFHQTACELLLQELLFTKHFGDVLQEKISPHPPPSRPHAANPPQNQQLWTTCMMYKHTVTIFHLEAQPYCVSLYFPKWPTTTYQSA